LPPERKLHVFIVGQGGGCGANLNQKMPDKCGPCLLASAQALAVIRVLVRPRNLFSKSGIQSCPGILPDSEPLCLPAGGVQLRLRDTMHNSICFRTGKCFKHASGKLLISLALGLLLSACGGGNGDGGGTGSTTDGGSSNANPVVPVPLTAASNTVVAYSS
jgi:hypothetical protein